MPKYTSNSKNVFPKIYLFIKMTDFQVKRENILEGFIRIHDMIYVS